MTRERLKDAELQQIVEEMSDIEYEYDEDADDSVNDPDYQNSDSSRSNSDDVNATSKRPRLETDPQINRDIRDAIASSDSDISLSHSSDESEQEIADQRLPDLRVIWTECAGKNKNCY